MFILSEEGGRANRVFPPLLPNRVGSSGTGAIESGGHEGPFTSRRQAATFSRPSTARMDGFISAVQGDVPLVPHGVEILCHGIGFEEGDLVGQQVSGETVAQQVTEDEDVRVSFHDGFPTDRRPIVGEKRNLASPLADVRGPAGRIRAVAAAIRTGLARGDDPDRIEERIRCAEAAGLSLTLW